MLSFIKYNLEIFSTLHTGNQQWNLWGLIFLYALLLFLLWLSSHSLRKRMIYCPENSKETKFTQSKKEIMIQSVKIGKEILF